MTTRRWLLLLLVLGAGTAAPAQQPAAPVEAGATTVVFGRAAAPPAGRASMAVTLTPAQGVEIGTLELTLTFPAVALSFVGAETAGVSDAVGAGLETDVKHTQGGATELRVVLSTLAGKRTARPLPEGNLAYLIFQLPASAKMGTRIDVKTTGRALNVTDPRKTVEPLAVLGATVDVAAPAVTSCFFYMH